MMDDDTRPGSLETYYTSMKEADTDCYWRDDTQDFQLLLTTETDSHSTNRWSTRNPFR